MAGKLAFCLPHARSLKYVCACTQPHTQTPKSKQELISLNCPLYFNHPCTFIPREVCAALFQGSVPWLVSEGLMGGKGGSHISMPHSTPALPCPVPICDPDSRTSRPSPNPNTVKASGSKGDLPVERAGQWKPPSLGLVSRWPSRPFQVARSRKNVCQPHSENTRMLVKMPFWVVLLAECLLSDTPQGFTGQVAKVHVRPGNFLP